MALLKREARAGNNGGVDTAFWSVAITLMLLSVMSYLDRQILALLVPDLHRDLGLSDLQVGTLIGPAFIVIYLLALLVAATIVDRFNKVVIITGGTVVWAVMTFASALARSYEELLFLRAGLAVGEAMLGPAATALIGDLFAATPRRRVTATAIFLMGSTIGASGSAAFGAFAIQIVRSLQVTLPRVGPAGDWRLALIAVSLPSFVLAVILFFIGRGASRRRPAAAVAAATRPAGLRAHLRVWGASYLLLFAAVNVMVMVQVGAFIWAPSYLMRRFGLSQIGAGYAFGTIALIGGVSGTLASTWVLRRRAPDGTVDQFARLVLLVGPAGMALLAAAMLAPSLALCLGLMVVALVLIGVLVTLPMQFLQAVAPDSLKGRIAVGMYLVLYLFTSGLGPIVPPAIDRLLAPGGGQLGRAIAIAAILSAAIATVLAAALLRAARRLPTPD